jgi:hypothetical protein
LPLASKPPPPNSHRLPLWSVQVTEPSRPPGVFEAEGVFSSAITPGIAFSVPPEELLPSIHDHLPRWTLAGGVEASTVSVLEPEIEPEVAVMVTVPAETPVARPEALIVAYTLLLLDQVTVEVQVDTLASEYVQLAAYCCMPAAALMDAVDGVTEIAVRLGFETVTVAEPLSPPKAAVRTAVPGATPVATPLPVMTAVAGLLLDQVASEVQLVVVLLAYAQVAVNCWVPVPAWTVAAPGVTVMPVSAGLLTVMVPVPETAPDVAVMVAVPLPTPVANPPALMDATALLLLAHFTVVVQVELELLA